jgi:multidrug efflux pump subunit AcrB
LRAVDEVGNPTILATLTVVAAILPMAFVGGLMGPYMRPIPVGASAAMLFSLLVAFIVTPWAALRLLKGAAGHHGGHEREDLLTRVYRRFMGPLIASGRMRLLFLGVVVLLLLGAVAFVPFGWVKVKMLPFDNKSEFQVIVDMPKARRSSNRARDVGPGGHGARGSRRRGRADLRGHRVALQLQRPGAPLLPAARAASRPTCR